jgi:hypothetical protein
VLHRASLLERCELLAHDVLRRAVGARALLLAQRDLDLVDAEAAAGRVAVVARDEREAPAVRANDERDDQAAQLDRAGQALDVRLV